jgi:hypothetical protein
MLSMPLAETILQHARALPEGAVLLPADFRGQAHPAAVRRALSRLVQSGALARIARGHYVRLLAGRFGPCLPAPAQVVAWLAAKSGETIVPHGAFAANALGLCLQVPARDAFLTTGRPRRLQFGRMEVLVGRAPRWVFALEPSAAGGALRALDWLGPAEAPRALGLLRQRLSAAHWQELVACRQALPAWLARALERAAGPHALSAPDAPDKRPRQRQAKTR